LIFAGVAVLAATVVVVMMLKGDDAAPAPSQPTAAPSKPDATSAKNAPAKPDPAKDPAVWRALPAAERADLTLKYLTALDRRDAKKLADAHAFLVPRGETDAAQRVVEFELARDPSSAWARAARGEVAVSEKIDACLAECVKAEEVESPGVRKIAAIKKARQPESGTWWADAAQQKEIDAALAQVRAEEKELSDPFNWAVAKWRAHRRRIDVMKDQPAIDDTSGPYLVFSQVKAPSGTPIESVPEPELTRAKRALRETKELYAALYEGFLEAFGKEFGLPRFDRSNTDDKTMLKANVFADGATLDKYRRHFGRPTSAKGPRAYYEPEEPRFITTFDAGGAGEADAEQVQCHEATHQLLHLYTWDATRKASGKELSWSECRTRPIWLEEGFAEFFSAHRREGAKYVWMQPLESGMEEIWATSQAFAKKRWATWSLDEMLAVADMEQVEEQAARRVTGKVVRKPTEQQAADIAVAVRIMRPLFHAKSWSLVYFLWNHADETGKPLHRAAFARLVAGTLRATQTATAGQPAKTRVLSAADFRKALGLESEDRFRAFEKSWLAWETAFIGKAQRPEWAATRDRVMQTLGVK
jgi:hypothetical protein